MSIDRDIRAVDLISGYIQSVRSTVGRRIGNSMDASILLCSILRSAGFDAMCLFASYSEVEPCLECPPHIGERDLWVELDIRLDEPFHCWTEKASPPALNGGLVIVNPGMRGIREAVIYNPFSSVPVRSGSIHKIWSVWNERKLLIPSISGSNSLDFAKEYISIDATRYIPVRPHPIHLSEIEIDQMRFKNSSHRESLTFADRHRFQSNTHRDGLIESITRYTSDCKTIVTSRFERFVNRPDGLMTRLRCGLKSIDRFESGNIHSIVFDSSKVEIRWMNRIDRLASSTMHLGTSFREVYRDHHEGLVSRLVWFSPHITSMSVDNGHIQWIELKHADGKTIVVDGVSKLASFVDQSPGHASRSRQAKLDELHAVQSAILQSVRNSIHECMHVLTKW